MFEIQSVHFTVYKFDFMKMETTDPIYTFKSFPEVRLKEMSINKEQLAQEMGLENITFDYALPQHWLDSFVDDYCPSGVLRNDYYALVRSTCFATYVDSNMYIISGCTEVQHNINKDTSIERTKMTATTQSNKKE